ncbi:hypothetical protein R3P38DRAFT_2882559 [Favolaschia claudopus]|uniref:BTB domain-containing protein n=1 Tax=Favolaschia claudopus TaxID=2862362 RepID=A0AAW0D2H6_9AGAR
MIMPNALCTLRPHFSPTTTTMSLTSTQSLRSDPSTFIPIHPFCNPKGADTILRSSDGVDFYVLRDILSLVSPIFETMFQLPQPNGGSEIPVVVLQERAAQLEMALRFFYPGALRSSPATIRELKQVIDLLISKYDMQSLVPSMRQQLERFQISQPLSVYAIAWTYRWKDVAVAAAKETLKHPLRAPNTEAPPELEDLPAAAYHNLIHYHSCCGQAAQTTINSYTIWEDYAKVVTSVYNKVCLQHSPGIVKFGQEERLAPLWIATYIRVTGLLLSITPETNIYDQSTIYSALSNGTCAKCNQLDELVKVLKVNFPQTLRKEMDKIELKF